MTLWNGRFDKGLSENVKKFTQSISFDKILYESDIEGSIAHVEMLASQKIIPIKSAKKIVNALKKIKEEIKEGNFQFSEDYEDIHMNIEKALINMIGPDGAMVHTARSRNDQVNLDTRLYIRKKAIFIKSAIVSLQKSLLKKAEEYKDTIMPGYTHLQHAQPILFAHHLLAYCEMFERDKNRLEDSLKRIFASPLGAGAIAGTTLPINRNFTAKKLGFKTITRNSIDTVADRDFICEFLSVLAIFGMHISRLCEDIILWSSKEFDFIKLGDEFCTGSSLMPQKKNPDIAELTRGKTGRLYGNLMAILTVCKGLPMSYNRDLQEDKEPLFDSINTVEAILSVFPDMIDSISCNTEKMKELAQNPYLMATDIAEELVRKGVPFRDAHHMVGELVKLSEKKHIPLNQIPYDEAVKVAPLLPPDFYKLFDPCLSIRKRTIPGAPSYKNVKQNINFFKKYIIKKS
ncbi:MAG TPA: argininosuccinate lyase [Victivallales bacterium]|nr:argininosuccinate lyase [Victivallales bacterium]HPO89776.1 argininosuccinate lyase [Victivallales bacterium]HRR06572.1 argininosuccinate lyase [Victivallales bacterium]HRU01199.1 argininosuccinate lyase [Victivallales bacterium]